MRCCAKTRPLLLAVLTLAGLVRGQEPAPPRYADHSRLLVYLDENGTEQPVRSRGDWQRRRRHILLGMQEAMGKLPDRSDLVALDVRQTERFEGDGYSRVTISLAAEQGDRIPAYLYVPAPRTAGRRYPAMLALHPTSPLGKGVPAGLSTRPNRAYALELARRGYVVLAPDYPSFGDYAYDFAADRYVSGTMKGIANHMRCVDLLVARDDVDPERIGVIGHSLGGHNAMFAGVFDSRLKVVVSSCGWTPFHDYYGGKIAGWTSPRYMPRLKEAYDLDPDRVPFDFHEVVGALAPRAFFSCSPTGDHNFDVAGVRKGIAEARRIYDLFTAEQNLQVRYPDCGHDFPAAVRFEAYAFIDKVLHHTPVAARQRTATPKLRAGIAVVDITPPRGYRMSGYFHERLNTGTHDPLLARTLCLRQGTTEIALVFCDIIGISLDVSSRTRSAASKRTDIPASNILIAATHSHTGPLYFGALRNHFHEQAIAAHGRDPQETIDYGAELSDKLVDVIARAQALQTAGSLAAAVEQERGLSFNRRFHMKGGTVRFNPGKLNPNILRPAGPIDPDVSVLSLGRPGRDGLIGTLTNFALHLDTVGGTEYSADYPYYLEKSLRQVYGPHFTSFFGTGACGDINHIDVSHTKPQSGQGEAQRIGTRLTAAVKKAIERAKPLTSTLGTACERIDLPLQRYDVDAITQARQDLKKVGTRALPFLDQVTAYKICALQLREGGHLPADVQVFRISDDVAIVGLPGEVFVELAMAIKRASPFATTMVIELSNDAPGYIPTRKAFTEGSYETVNSRIQSGGGEVLVETALRLLRQLKKES